MTIIVLFFTDSLDFFCKGLYIWLSILLTLSRLLVIKNSQQPVEHNTSRTSKICQWILPAVIVSLAFVYGILSHLQLPRISVFFTKTFLNIIVIWSPFLILIVLKVSLILCLRRAILMGHNRQKRIQQSTISRGRQNSRAVGDHVVYNTRSRNKKSSVGRVSSKTEAQETRSSGRPVFCSTGSQQSTSSGRQVVCSTRRKRYRTRGGHLFRRIMYSIIWHVILILFPYCFLFILEFLSWNIFTTIAHSMASEQKISFCLIQAMLPLLHFVTFGLFGNKNCLNLIACFLCIKQTATNTRPAGDISCISKKSLGKRVSLQKNRSVSIGSSKSINNGKLSTSESFHSGNLMIIRCSHSLEHPRSFVVYKSRSSSLDRIEINKTDEAIRKCTMNSNNSFHVVRQTSSKTSDVIKGGITLSTISCSSTTRSSLTQCLFNKTWWRSQKDIVNRRSLRSSTNSI